MLDKTATENRTDLSALENYKSRFRQFMDQAAAADPGDEADIEDLKSSTLQVVDGDCASAVVLRIIRIAAA